MIFWVVSGVKGQRMVQNDKTFCLSHFISGTMHHQRIIQEFHLGISHERHLVMRTLHLGCFGEGATVSPLLLFSYISLLDLLIWNTFFVDNSFYFFCTYFKLWVKTNYLLAWMFFFCTLATAFPTSYCMKTVLVGFENSALLEAHSTSFPVLFS